MKRVIILFITMLMIKKKEFKMRLFSDYYAQNKQELVEYNFDKSTEFVIIKISELKIN